jgi:hypothetical protein
MYAYTSSKEIQRNVYSKWGKKRFGTNRLFLRNQKAKCSCQLKGRAKLLVRIVSYHTELITQYEAKALVNLTQ